MSDTIPTRPLHAGMGVAVAERTVLRKLDPVTGEVVMHDALEQGAPFRWETWGEVAHRVALGNSLLCPKYSEKSAVSQELEYDRLRDAIAQGKTLMSGRHLQHGDAEQPDRNLEVFTNCLDYYEKLQTQEYGNIAIGEVVGQTVEVRCADGAWRPAQVKAYGEQRLFALDFVRKTTGPDTPNKHKTVLATRNHRWLTPNGQVTDNIQVGDVIQAAPIHDSLDPKAVIDGIIFGDGGSHVRGGGTYASLRVPESKAKYKEICNRLHEAGYRYTTPTSADGDRVYYLGRHDFAKSMPWTLDPSYVAGFIHGWWLTDGSMGTAPNTRVISTSNAGAAEWLKEACGYIGWTLLSHRVQERKEGDGSYPNGKALHIVRMKCEPVEWKLDAITDTGRTEKVYCVEEPVTQSFTLAGGMVTGNCATSANTFSLFYLLLNGSGVGRCYDDDMMLVDWDNAPAVVCVLDSSHADFDYSAHTSVRDARHMYGEGRGTYWFEVPDTREGWAQALEVWENAAFQKIHKDKVLILDFTKVRKKGSPIRGMQNRPSSGPVPLMNAFLKAGRLKGSNLSPWRQAMYMDHYFAECVLVGGARRAARMSTKFWKDKTVIDFIRVKRPIEYQGMSRSRVIEFRDSLTDSGSLPPEAFLWSSNDSVAVDQEFWDLLRLPKDDRRHDSEDAVWARKVWAATMDCAYGDGTGEPGLINVDKLNMERESFQKLAKNGYIGGPKYTPREDSEVYLNRLAKRAQAKKYFMITNPCGEIPLSILGGYCTIADLVPYHCESIDDFETVARTVTRALIRTNTMPCLYQAEVTRTNRIGIGLTGVHEFAWKFFGLTFHDLIDPDRSEPFWGALERVAKAIKAEAESYSEYLRVEAPHTGITVKPSGTVSKLFGLTEGWHLPSMKFYLRWVQFRNDDPLVEQYIKNGYPHRVLETYRGHTIIGFPTQPVLSDIMPDEKIVTAGQAAPEDQFRWLQLCEEYWINGAGKDFGNQCSYTLKYDPVVVSFAHLKKMMLEFMPTIRCCSVMPQAGTAAYEYQPEQSVTKAEYEKTAAAIRVALAEDVDRASVSCDSGACPIDWVEGDKAAPSE